MQKYLEFLFEAVSGAEHVLILTHNNPDPDAIASALALRYLLSEKLGVEGKVGYRGIVSRAENRALLEYLDHPIQPLKDISAAASTLIALVDTQPGAGNNIIPPDAKIAVVIDHHPLREATMEAKFVDVRIAVGSTATILTEYFRAAEIEPSQQVATALFYGIKTDTMGLSRGVSLADVDAYAYLQPRINTDALTEIEQAQVPLGYFKSISSTLNSAVLYKDTVIAFIGAMDYPDLVAEMADLLLRLEGSRWIICLGTYEERLILSVRTRAPRGGAGQLAQTMVKNEGAAGGHGIMAGGQVALKQRDARQLVDRLIRRALDHLNLTDVQGISLI